jgi:3-hydroxyisobutyrate dehydrogenase-like beta-hydroxyacid dehydrogenase
MRLALKDVSLVLQAAASSRVPMPLASVLNNHLLAAKAKGRGNLDWTALAGEVSEAAGLWPTSSAESSLRT